MDYTAKLVSILYMGIKHRIKDLEEFRSFISMNLEDSLDFVIEGDSLIFLKEGESFFIVEISETEINFYPGESQEALMEEPELVRDALLSFLVQFKNYSIIESAQDIAEGKDFKNPVEPNMDNKDAILSRYAYDEIGTEDEDSWQHSGEDPSEKNSYESEEEEESDSDEWI